MWPFKKEEEPRHSEEPPYLEKYGATANTLNVINVEK